MGKLKFLPILFAAVLAMVSFASCSGDDDEGGRASAIKGEDLLFCDYVEYLDGEEVDRGSAQGFITYLLDDGTVELGRTYGRLYSAATWTVNGNAIIVTFYDGSGPCATERYEIEKVYDFGGVVLRLYLDDKGMHYRRISCEIDSDKYDNAEIPDWWYEEW